MKKIIVVLVIAFMITLSGCSSDKYYTQEEVNDLILGNYAQYEDGVFYYQCSDIGDYDHCDLILNVNDTETNLYDALIKIQELELRIEQLESGD
jgi:hypothetical protein